ncbi:hypothetical protein [Luteibacter sp. UNCMF366Tsu5.1]|uniref:hypothetical protein n=1 Tax=Luteibacter sp. UNCMF366Tsu5.1 TaxID=1502758 RepID=UPI0009301AB2|nr:hypothetical protein [Luteibacter sp. UNCMF366Tsu5.1]
MSLPESREEVERCFGVSLDERESDYHGGLYYLHRAGNGGRLMLKANVDLYDDEPAERAFPEWAVLLYVDFVGDIGASPEFLPPSFTLLAALESGLPAKRRRPPDFE